MHADLAGYEGELFACRGDAAVGVALWARVLLPQVLGSPLPSPGSSPACASLPRLGKEPAERALQFLDDVLAREEPAVEASEPGEQGNSKWHPGNNCTCIPGGPLVRTFCAREQRYLMQQACMHAHTCMPCHCRDQKCKDGTAQAGPQV